ncbi:MAG: 2-oxoacid:acceptor oxidoreductase family protein [Acidobacteriota bacterium]|nr:2-oxoacid:acceptor oxidoreductase family protein [Acidobacteriota bacterium]
MTKHKARFPGIRVTTNGNQLVSRYTESLICDAGVFYPITPSTEMGEHYQAMFAEGALNAFGRNFMAIEAEGEHAAQGGAVALSVSGKRVVNFTSGQGIVYGMEQYFHAPGKLSTMVLEVGARALTRHALNVHCGHDDVYSTLDTGWLVCFSKNAQQTADQALILRRVTEQALNPGINCQDGMLTTHLDRTFLRVEPELVREYLGRPEDMIPCPTESQKRLFGPRRRRVPAMIDLEHPLLLGPVQNQEHYMNGVAARRNHFSEPILSMFEEAYETFAELTGRRYGLISPYRCDDAETVFVCLGSAAENIEAAVDHLRDKGERVGVVHVNVLRPFPEAAVVDVLAGKKQVIVMERTDEPLAVGNPLARDIRAALDKAEDQRRNGAYPHLSPLEEDRKPEIFSGVYGLGSRDFRPEGILGAYEFATGRGKRQDGLSREDGVRFFYVGIDHPYAVISEDTPSLLPGGSIAVRLHSIGGWGMITTGKNLSGILGAFSGYIAQKFGRMDAYGKPEEVIHISANPKYGSEKKGAPTSYFLVAAPERVRVNCDLKDVDVVLCCDPKAFLHTNPLEGLRKGGAFVWESHCEDPAEAWRYIPIRFRREIITQKIQIYILPGFKIAREATDRGDLQTRMQGNSFLGAFFSVSPFLTEYAIPEEAFQEVVRKQYDKKFGRFGNEVIESNMKVMLRGFSEVREVPHGTVDDLDYSSFSDPVLSPHTLLLNDESEEIDDKTPPIFRRDTFDAEFRAGLGYHQPSSALASVGCMASGTGAQAHKYVSRRETPVFIPEACTQCMECISICPDTAMPNTTQPLDKVLETAVLNYVTDERARTTLLEEVPGLADRARARMHELLGVKDEPGHFRDIVRPMFEEIASRRDEVDEEAVGQVRQIIDILPLAYKKANLAFKSREKKEPGQGGIFGIYVSDLCKGCGACVEVCDHGALEMHVENEHDHADTLSASQFLDLLPDTDPKYLGIYDAMSPAESKAAALRYHLMVQSNYQSLVSGDGACAGCGEKSAVRSIVTVTEALMRPIFQRKAERLEALASRLKEQGPAMLAELKQTDAKAYGLLRRSILHLIMGYGAESEEATEARIETEFHGDDSELIECLVETIGHDATAHRRPNVSKGQMEGGMSVMAMTAHTGCNTVFGSTPPNNPHPYPWMNSLFQDGTTIGWLLSEGFVQDHLRRSIIPERLAGWVLGARDRKMEDLDYFYLTHFSDAYLSDEEILELPRVWAVGGDGGMGDIGFQNVSKVVLQNRPNMQILMLDTQVYSNTGGQNSESSPMTGGFDMNQFGLATEGKMTEMKSVAECFMAGHGSPYLAQVSLANTANLYKALLEGLCYRGTAYFQVYTTCQPEHGVPDHASPRQAGMVRDSRGLAEFTYNPTRGETYGEALELTANPDYRRDWYWKPKAKRGREKFAYTPAHWAVTEARFRNHHKKISEAEAENLIPLDKMLMLVTMDDVVKRRHLVQGHRAYIPRYGVAMTGYDVDGNPVYYRLSRQMVLFCIERRKSWRMLQSRAGFVNEDYLAQKELLSSMDHGKLSLDAYLREEVGVN